MDKLLLFLNSAYLGLGAFFSFYVAPTLFKVLEKTEAGKVVERVFPVYFSLGVVVMLISTLLGWKVSRSFFLLALINLLIHLVHRFYVLPLPKGCGLFRLHEMAWHIHAFEWN